MNAVIITIVHVIVFLGAGLFVATNLVKRKLIPEQYTLITAYAVSSLIGYGLFYFYAYSPSLGTYGTAAFYLFGFIGFITLAYESGKSASLRRLLKLSVLPPLALILLTCSFYSVITLTCRDIDVPAQEPYNVYQACILDNAPGDNVLPEFFGDKILLNKDGEPSGDWKLADRPPLQIGSVISILDILPSDAAKLGAYQVVSTFLQLAWIAGLWALLKSMKLSKEKISFVLLGSIFTGFFYYNSIYVWPKLLAAGFAISAVSLILYGRATKPKARDEYLLWFFAALLFALSFLSHGSTLFTLVPLGIYLVIKNGLPSAKTILLACGVALLIYAPWMAYKARTTSSDRLVKWHLAGAVAVDDRSTSKAIIDAYKNINPADWTRGRLDNLRSLFKWDPKTPYATQVIENLAGTPLLSKLRLQEFFATIPAFGLFNIGWVTLLYARKKDKVLYEKIKPLGVLALVSLAIWCVAMFIPASTVIHQNSYTTMAMLFTFLLLSISALKPRFRYSILSAQILLFFAVWVFQVSRENHRQPLLVSGIFIVGLLATLLLLYFKTMKKYFSRI